MSEVIAAPVPLKSPLMLLIADHQRRGIHELDARDSLGSQPHLIGRVLAGGGPSQRDDTVRRLDVDMAVRSRRRNLGLHGSRDLIV